MQKGDLIAIEFTGKDSNTGKVFDTTNKDTAQKEGIYNEKRNYGPVTIVAGMGELLHGLEHEILGMQIGEEKNVSLEPDQAFGERNPELVKVIPLSEFQKNNISATPGTIVNANDMIGKVQSVSGGRVRVDFNPDLAGKKVEYQLKIVKQFTSEEEKFDALKEKAFPGNEKPTIRRNNDLVEVRSTVKGMAPRARNIPGFVKMVLDSIPSITKVVVSTEYERKDFERMHVHENGEMHANDEGHVKDDHKHEEHTQ